MNYSKERDPFVKYYRGAKELSAIPETSLLILFKSKNKTITSFMRQGYEHFIKPFVEFCKNHRVCANCGELYEGKVNYKCPREECRDYVLGKRNEINEKRNQTNMDKYGVTNVSQSQLIKNKKTETFMEHYGVSNAFKSEDVKSKIRQSNLERYGAVNPAHSPGLKQKRDITNLKKYGSVSPLGSKEVRLKSRETLKKNYGVENPAQSPVIQEKIKQTNLKRFGCENPNQNIDVRRKTKQTNLAKYGVAYYAQQHLKNLDDYYDENVWLRFKSTTEASKYFGLSAVHARTQLYKYNPEIVKNRSKSQTLLLNAIPVENKIANTKSVIPPKELDIYLPDYKLAIEYDGLLFHSQGISNHTMLNTPNFDKKYHLQKTLECNSQGIQLLHIFEGEDIDLWLSMINSKLGLNERIYARNCYVSELKPSDLRDFLNENHLQGFCNASIAIGLYLRSTKSSTKVQDIEASKLVAVMTFGKPRFSKGYDYELVRFCSLKGYNIIGGASKLWKFFLKKYNPQSVISYANLRFSNGKLYENLGFSLKHRSEPNYYYFKPNEGILHSRNKFQKHKLPSILDNFNPDESEVENMFANGYRRIFDCGNLVYEWFAKFLTSKIL